MNIRTVFGSSLSQAKMRENKSEENKFVYMTIAARRIVSASQRKRYGRTDRLTNRPTVQPTDKQPHIELCLTTKKKKKTREKRAKKAKYNREYTCRQFTGQKFAVTIFREEQIK